LPRWKIEYSEQAKRALRKLDKPVKERIEDYLDHLPEAPDPRDRGKPLSGPRAGQWRYRIGDYRAICELRDNVLIVLVLEIEHRSKVYKRQ
jgi:mRNA interferase RelE/StbE